MTQNNENAPRRALTPEQKRRILQKRKMRRLKKRLMIIVPIAAVLLAALIIILATAGNKKGDPKVTEPLAVEAVNVVEGEGGDPAASADPSASPSVEPTATPAPVSDEPFVYDEQYILAARGEQDGPLITPDYSNVDPAKMDRWPETEEGRMPVLYKADTQENIIAVTVDDCFQGENLRQIVQCALDNDADLTIFPIGKNLEHENIAQVIKWAWENGMEIENHTYNHAGMYHYDDERMTSEMWYQNAKVSEVLGVNYQMHFFRPKGGDERNCQRVHAYANQMDYSAIAMWTQSGSTDPMDSLFSNLAPGRIYLFHTTDNDLTKLLEFIPGAVQRGYRLVTLNEMFGLPDNETSDISTVAEKPDLQPFKILPQTLKKTTYVRASAVVQKRLIELGWLEGEADGVFGNSSFMATGFFQMEAGISANGVANGATQQVLFSDDAPRGSKERIAELTKQLGK